MITFQWDQPHYPQNCSELLNEIIYIYWMCWDECRSLGPVYNRSIEPIYNRPIDDNSVEPLYNVIDGRRDTEPIYNVLSGRSHDSHMTGYCHDNVQVELDDVRERSNDSNITDEAVTYYVQMDSQEPAATHDDSSHYYI